MAEVKIGNKNYSCQRVHTHMQIAQQVSSEAMKGQLLKDIVV